MLHLATSKTLLALFSCTLLLALGSFHKLAAQSNSPQEIFLQEINFGSGQNFFSLRLSSDGNILWIRSPIGITHIDQQEGYVVCGTGIANAYDPGFGEGTWGPSTFEQPGGESTLPIFITRQSLDGKLELKQTIDWNPQEREVFFTMTLKNISAEQLTDVKLARYFNGDISRINSSLFPDATDDIYDHSSNSVWGKDNGTGPNHHSLSLVAQTLGQSHSTAVETKANWDTTKTTCTPIEAPVPTAPGDYTGRLTYNLGSFNPGVSKTVKFIYRRA